MPSASARAVTRRELLAALAAAPSVLSSNGAAAVPRTDFVKAVDLSYYGVGGRSLREQVLELLTRTELNSVVIDVKGDRGFIPYESRVPLAIETGRPSGCWWSRRCRGVEGRTVAYADREMARLEAEGLDYLHPVKMRFGPLGGVDCAVRFDDPVEEILREAEAFGADLIAVTTEGRGAVRRSLLGSVAEQVVRKARGIYYGRARCSSD